MGYDLHITRANEWSESEADPISLDEWIRHVESDREMRLDGHAEARSPDGSVIRIESPGLAVWLKYPKHGEGETMAWFYWHRGEISVKNPDEEIIRKMKVIAQALGARVQGDDSEYYD